MILKQFAVLKWNRKNKEKLEEKENDLLFSIKTFKYKNQYLQSFI